MKHQHSWWGLDTLPSNELHCVVTEFSLTWSVFSKCPCIQHRKYACNISKIWFFCLQLWSQYWRTCILLDYNVTFIELSSRITHLRNSYSHVRFKSWNISLVEVVITSKNDCVFIRDLSNLTLQIIFNAWWASMDVGLKRPIAWNNSAHATSWQFQLNYAIEKTTSTRIICIVCHQVLRHPSEHGTRSIGKHLLAKAHIAKLNELTVSGVTELTSSTVVETALAILKRQGSRVITVVSLQRKMIFDI